MDFFNSDFDWLGKDLRPRHIHNNFLNVALDNLARGAKKTTPNPV
jgi:hypothetical protein